MVTVETRTVWRQCLVEVGTINIPRVESIRPTKTWNAFVTKAVVLLAFLIVHAEDDKPLPKISGKFKIDPLKHNTNAMENEILNSGIDYVDAKLKWNTFVNAEHHIGGCLSIGCWLANQLTKARKYGTWRITDRRVDGSSKGLYEPYKNLLEKIGIQVPVKPFSG